MSTPPFGLWTDYQRREMASPAQQRVVAGLNGSRGLQLQGIKHLESGLLDHRYQLLRQLGAGTRKRAYLAIDVLSQRRVVVGVYRPEMPISWRMIHGGRARLVRELGAHPHVVEVLADGTVWADDGSPVPYVVTRYIAPSQTLEQLVERGTFSADGVLKSIDQVAVGLGHLHAAGLSHGSPSTSNILAARGNLLLLNDFDWIRPFGAPAPEDRTLKVVHGLSAFQTPEELTGQPYDGRSDLYRLGISAYFLATGTYPWLDGVEPDDTNAVYRNLMRRLSEMPLPPSHYAPREIDDETDAIVLQLLRPDPDARFQTVGELRAVIADLADRRGFLLDSWDGDAW